jgi:hypothetical protein
MARGIFKKNKTVEAVKELVKKREAEFRAAQTKKRADAERRSIAFEPLSVMLSEVEDEYVRVSVLRAIWPLDFDKRPDRIKGLIEGYMLSESLCCGVKVRTATGRIMFETDIDGQGKISYIYSYESMGMRPVTREFSSREDWLQAFLYEMTKLIET